MKFIDTINIVQLTEEPRLDKIPTVEPEQIVTINGIRSVYCGSIDIKHFWLFMTDDGLMSGHTIGDNRWLQELTKQI